MIYGPETDIVCHKDGLPLYELPCGTKTYFSTRAKVHAPLKPTRGNGTIKREWRPEDVVRACTRAEYNASGKRRGWLAGRAKKAGVTIEGYEEESPE